MTEDKDEAEKILAAEADFEFTLSYEVIPAIELKPVNGIKVTREVVEISEDEVNEQILKIAESARTYETKKARPPTATASPWTTSARSTAKPSTAARIEDAELVLGSGRFIPGFEEQLVGAQGRRREDHHRYLPGRLSGQEPGRQGSHLRRHRQGSRRCPATSKSTTNWPPSSASNRPTA